MNEIEIQKFMDDAIDKANAIKKATVDYEIAKTSTEMLAMNDRKLLLIVGSPGFNDLPGGFNVKASPETIKKITELLNEEFRTTMHNAMKTIKGIFGEKENDQTEVKEEHKSIINKEFDAVVDEMIKSMDEDTKKAIVAPVQQKKIKTNEVISDEQLIKENTINKKSVAKIAEEYNLPASALYKRLEAIRKKNAKEGACCNN